MIGFFGGLLLDNLLGTRPLLTLVGATLGVAAAMYTIWDVARKAMRK
jgi:F0F1-type ATP synthase assembly protein I